jgi:hypothetical protein
MQEEATPVCLHCFTPVHPLQHFCHRCGQTVGQLTPYLPYLGIAFNYQPFGVLWHRIWHSRRRSFAGKLFRFLFIVCFAPELLLALPSVLWHRFKGSSHRRVGEHGQE